MVHQASGGLLTVGMCYSACNAGYVTCLAALGITAGVTAPVTWWAWATGVPAAAAGCSAVQGVCMAVCVVATP